MSPARETYVVNAAHEDTDLLTETKEPKPPNEYKDFDDILSLVGSQGKFQKILLYGVLCPLVTISPFLAMTNIFMLDVPDHWCFVDGMLNVTESLEEWKNLTIPWEVGPDGAERHSQCKRYVTIGRNDTMACEKWTYDRTDYEGTMSSDYDWVCDRADIPTETFTVGTLGGAVGTVVFGILADRVGRKPMYFLSCFVNTFFRTISLFFPHNVAAFLSLQFLAGMSFPSIFSMPSLIVAEVCGAEYRSWTYAATWMIWVVGNSILPLVAWACRTWFLFGMISAVPGVLLFFFFPIIPESPRWLISVGKSERAIEVVKTMAKVNQVRIPDARIKEMVEGLVKKMKAEKAASKQRIGFWTLFQKPRLAKNTICLIVAWGMNCLLYYGITLNTTSMAGNTFLNYFLLSIIELPGGYLAGILVEKTGRRWTQGAFFLLCVLSCAVCAIAVVRPNWDAVVIAGALGIKFGVTVTSMVVYLQGTEIFPTQLRSTGAGLASTISSIMGIAGPYIIYTGRFDASLPYTLLGVLSFIGVVSSISLPETLQQHLPETVEDANKFGKGVKFWSYLPKGKEDNPSVKK